ALGIDVSPEAVRMTRQRGARARRGDVFGPVPEEGRWATALLADGNIGIGGDPARLLARVRDLLAPDGVAIVELEAPGTGLVHDRLRLRLGDRESVAFDWALVGVDAIDDLATEADLSVAALRESGGRHAALLTRSQIG
ncbi:MAG: SAM-dependent methyltransferase, partial [Nocardioidaceae bacterium]